MGTELNLVNRLANQMKSEGKLVQFMSHVICECSTMARIDPQHLAWCLENIVNEKPAVEGICDSCGGALIQREDDKADVIKRRLEVYAEQTEPIISFYRNEGLLISISATGAVNEITESAIAALSRVK